MSQATKPPVSVAEAAAPPNRRVALLTGLLGALAGVLPLIPGAAFVLDPLLRRRKTSSGNGPEFLKIAPLNALPADGSPRAFPVRADKQDAWNKFPNTDVGAVYLARQADGTVSCFNARCPHLGCTINYGAASQKFECPCHASSFSLDGQRSNAIPPRDMDALAAEVRDGDVWVQFQNFRAGVADRTPTA